jgi:ergothioneine biosynthesis protein EgtB
MQQLLIDKDDDETVVYRTELGINHEQQHQELLLTDLKHAWSFNPLFPSYRSAKISSSAANNNSVPIQWLEFNRAVHSIGTAKTNFYFDNELPKHDVLIRDFQIANRLVTNAEFLEFVQSGGYANAQLWLSDGWSKIQQQTQYPIYWHKIDGQWFEFTLQGLQPLALNKPVCHINYYEADAFARWAEARLSTEFEWEVAAKQQAINGNFVESGEYHPLSVSQSKNQQFFGDCWEWTSSAYAAYPGFSPAKGAIGEYNGKFMCNQMVLRGGSCVTANSHIRLSYRNFFYPDARWQFSGIRLAKDI